MFETQDILMAEESKRRTTVHWEEENAFELTGRGKDMGNMKICDTCWELKFIPNGRLCAACLVKIQNEKPPNSNQTGSATGYMAERIRNILSPVSTFLSSREKELPSHVTDKMAIKASEAMAELRQFLEGY